MFTLSSNRLHEFSNQANSVAGTTSQGGVAGTQCRPRCPGFLQRRWATPIRTLHHVLRLEAQHHYRKC